MLYRVRFISLNRAYANTKYMIEICVMPPVSIRGIPKKLLVLGRYILKIHYLQFRVLRCTPLWIVQHSSGHFQYGLW